MGETRAPIKIAGPGKCLVSERGITAVGFAARAQVASLTTFILVMALVVMTLIVIFPSGTTLIVFGGGGGTILTALLKGRGAHAADKPVRFVLPWDAIADVRPDVHAGGVVMLVEDFDPRGTLHFVPDDGVEAFLDAASRCKAGFFARS